MKFTQKVFFITFIFVTICINVIGVIIINNSHMQRINSKIQSNISNIEDLTDILSFYDITDLKTNILKKDNMYYEIRQKDAILFTNLFMDTNEIYEKIEPSEDNIKSIIHNEILFMSVRRADYDIILAEDIHDIFDERRNQINFFMKVSIISSFIMALGLYIIILFFTNRINKLNKMVKRIADGDYSARAKDMGSDEIGNLAIQFNNMAQSVDTTIKEINRVSENRQNFIHNITHEIRTPLTSIIGFSSLIKNERVYTKEDIIEYSSRIYEEGNYINLISQRLMEIVLMDNPNIELENMNISDTISQIIMGMKQKFENVDFYEDITPNIYIDMDKTLLQSLILNITKNAIMSYEQYERKIVIISLEGLPESQVSMKIIDRGKGISNENLKKITEPFYTLNKDRNRQTSGMGLGLPLCIKICDVLNANFKIKSELGNGTCVNIKFKKNHEERNGKRT